jgi:hypothetical protein
VVNCINTELSVVALDPIIQDCKLPKSHVGDVVVYRAKRHLNTVAHNLAALSKSLGLKTWFDSVPSLCLASSCISS